LKVTIQQIGSFLGEIIIPIMSAHDGLISHEEVIANSLEAPVDIVTNWILIFKGTTTFWLVIIPLLFVLFGTAHVVQRSAGCSEYLLQDDEAD